MRGAHDADGEGDTLSRLALEERSGRHGEAIGGVWRGSEAELCETEKRRRFDERTGGRSDRTCAHARDLNLK